MNRILIFAGTTEGRLLSEWLCENRTQHLLCVATEYGEQVLAESPYVSVHTGRLDTEQMRELMRAEGVEIVVDATHPYAGEATRNILSAASTVGVRYLRLDRYQDRTEGSAKNSHRKNDTRDLPACRMQYFTDRSACMKALSETDGKILLTTGSKELPFWAADPALKERLVVRILPGAESIRICEEAGISGSRIIAMQGPFSEEMNLAILRDFDISFMVTKASGKTGGFEQKCAAAGKAGVQVCVIDRPAGEAGLSFEEVCRELEKFREADRTERKISLIGCGMGNRANMTAEAVAVLDRAELVFGAERLLRDCGFDQPQKVSKDKPQKAWAYYLAEDILPVLMETTGDAAILFSGDSGFYSGAAKMREALAEAAEAGKLAAKLEIYPGISSVSYLAAQFGIAWENAAILSVHGKGRAENWAARVLYTVRTNEKTFLLLSGVSDLREIGKLLQEEGELADCRILAGFQMGAQKQELLELTPVRCMEQEKEGLYSIFILNPLWKSPAATHGLPDAVFLRDKVPMTKEEIRAVSIAKLRLTRNARVFDIGSGTGSVAVEIARLSPEIRVWAVERKPEAAALIRKNAEKFHLRNIEVKEASAPDCFSERPFLPTHVFIGGSSGYMREIPGKLREMRDQNDGMQFQGIRVVATAVTFETMQELLQIAVEPDVRDYSIVNIAVTRTREAGRYHMMQAENPVWICSFEVTIHSQSES